MQWCHAMPEAMPCLARDASLVGVRRLRCCLQSRQYENTCIWCAHVGTVCAWHNAHLVHLRLAVTEQQRRLLHVVLILQQAVRPHRIGARVSSSGHNALHERTRAGGSRGRRSQSQRRRNWHWHCKKSGTVVTATVAAARMAAVAALQLVLVV